MGFGWLLICSFYKWMNLVTESLHLWGQFLFTNRSFFFPGCTEKQTFIKRHCISIMWSPCGYLFQVVVTHSLTRDVFFFFLFLLCWMMHAPAAINYGISSHIQWIFSLFFAICVPESELPSSVYITPKTFDSTLYGMQILMVHLEIIILKHECN